MLIVIAAVAALVLAAGCYLAFAGRISVPADHVGIMWRRFDGGRGPSDGGPSDGNLRTRRGLVARTLLPGRVYWLPPGLYTVRIVPRVVIPPGKVGLVTALAGRPRPGHRALGQFVACDHFQNGEAFLDGGGEMGRQVSVLAGDAVYSINTALFEVETVPAVQVPPGTVGLVIAKVGRIRPADRPFAVHVECDRFQDAGTFLANGGEQGRQLAVLVSGVYEINPWVFHVITVDTLTEADGLAREHLREVAVPAGNTGVVVTLDGREPVDGELGPLVPGHSGFQLPWAFLEQGGVRGVQKEVLPEGGLYALNPWFVRVVLIPSRVLLLEWRARQDDDNVERLDANLDEIVLVVEGYALRVEMTQALRIPASAAPHLVQAFATTSGLGGTVDGSGTVRRFVERILAGTVSAYFTGIAADARITDLPSLQRETQIELANRIRTVLAAWDIEAIDTHIGHPAIEDPQLAEMFRQIASERLRLENLEILRSQEAYKTEIEEMRLRAEQRRMALELETEINLFGVDNVMLSRLVREIARMEVPQVVDQETMPHLPTELIAQLLDRLREMRESRDEPPPAAPDDPAEDSV